MSPVRPWRRHSRISVVVPVFDVEDYLASCLDSVLAQTHRNLQVLLVDDGSRDGSGRIADHYAGRDRRVEVLHTANHGLGAARNAGVRRATGDYLTFLDSDDLLPGGAYATMLHTLRDSGSDFVAAAFERLDRNGLEQPHWMRRLHGRRLLGIRLAQHPEIAGDTTACNKLFRREFWVRHGLRFPEGVRYEDQPAITEAFLRARAFDVIPEVVYHWRVRDDGTSITQQRAFVADLVDRLSTKRQTLKTVRALAEPAVVDVFVDRVLAGDLHRYFVNLPGCSDEYWLLLRDAAREFWGDRSLARSGLLPVHRLTGWLVEQDRRADAEAVVEYAAAHDDPPTATRDGMVVLDLPVVDPETVPRHVLALRDHELGSQTAS